MGRVGNRKINRKQEEELRAFLEKARQPQIDEERKRQTLELLKLERKCLHVRVKKPYRTRVWEQMAYISPAAWFLQGILALVLGYELCAAEREALLAILLFCAPVMGVVGFTEILRSYRKNMWELEQACRYNLRQLMGMRLLIFAVVDSLVAGGVMLIGIQVGIEFGELLLCFLIPQMLSDSVYLYLMNCFRRQFQGTALVGAAIVMGALWMWVFGIIIENPGVLRRLSEPAALLMIVLGSVGLLALGCVRFLKGIEIECCGAT